MLQIAIFGIERNRLLHAVHLVTDQARLGRVSVVSVLALRRAPVRPVQHRHVLAHGAREFRLDPSLELDRSRRQRLHPDGALPAVRERAALVLDDGELELVAHLDLAVDVQHLAETEEQPGFPFDAPQEAETLLDGRHDALFPFLPRHVETLVEERDVRRPVQLVPPVGGYLELDPVAVTQREVALLVLVAEGYLDFGVIGGAVTDPPGQGVGLVAGVGAAVQRLQYLTLEFLGVQIFEDYSAGRQSCYVTCYFFALSEIATFKYSTSEIQSRIKSAFN